MQLHLKFGNKNFKVDTSTGIDLSTPLCTQNSVSAFFLPPPQYKPFRAGSFVGSRLEGGPCNCEEISFSPHGNGTHTECVGHISIEKVTIRETLKNHLFFGKLISIQPTKLNNGDHLITLDQVKPLLNDIEFCDALIIRTWPNNEAKLTTNYSGSNPCYLEPALGKALADAHIKHLIIDLPSVDREEDGGLLETHHAFWQYPNDTRLNATITELAYMPSSVQDGIYLLNLLIASFDSDASPSKPILYVLEEEN